MEKILIKSLKISNFKGIEDLFISDFNHGLEIYGDNATGKTTVMDAFTWLLFGKDSLNSAQFEIKPLTATGDPVHNLEHMVEAVLYLDKGPISLKKIFREKYVKRRGQPKATFSGHTNDFEINGVPCQQKEFTAQVNAICNEENFKLLTNPRYFNEVLHWTDRRRLLLTVCGDIADEKVINSKKELSALPDILGNHTVDQQKKIINAKLTEINEKLKLIPTRIDEREKSKVTVVRGRDELRELIAQAKVKKSVAEKDLADAESGGGIVERRKVLAELEGKIQDRKNAADKEKYERESNQRKELANLEQAAVTAGAATEKAVIDQTARINSKKSIVEQINNLKKRQEKLRKEWVSRDSLPYQPIKVKELCPTCGQDLPEEEVEEAARLAELNWNEKRAQDLEVIANEGKGIATQIETLQGDLATTNTQIKKDDDIIANLADTQSVKEGAVDLAKQKHEKANLTIPPDLELDGMISEADGLRLEINGLDAGNYEMTLAANNELERAEKLVESYQADLLQLDANVTTDIRIAELEKEEVRLSTEYERLEGELFTIENFIKAKVNMLESKIKRKFKYASFKLFSVNINGGLEECCETTLNGVPYSSLNNGARINAGLDICNTLSEHYGISLPVFIDNSEAITRLLQTDAQQIRLFVSMADKNLRIEKA